MGKKMNKFKSLLIAALSAVTVTSTTASFIAVNAETGNEGGQVAASTVDAAGIIKNVEGEGAPEITGNGIMLGVPGADTVGGGEAWKYKARIPGNDEVSRAAFSFRTNDKITLKISAKFFDEEGNKISQSQNGYALDIYMHNKVDNSQLAMLRIWTDSWGALNGAHSYHLYGNDWNDCGAQAALDGNATESSEFFIQLDKTNFVSSTLLGELKPLGTEEFTSAGCAKLNDVEEVYFLINGDNGFTNTTEITVKEINGQSLASADGNITDTVKPVFDKTVPPATLEKGVEFTMPVNAYDLLGEVTYKVKVGDAEAIDGKTFVPQTEGELKVTLIATDAAGNSAEKEYTFNVINSIEPPHITNLPELADAAVDYLSYLTFDKPEFTDETGVATTVLNLYKVKTGEETEDTLVATLEENSAGKFSYFIDSQFVSADYKVVYEITNSGGVTVSEPVTVKLTLNAVEKAEFVEPQTNRMLADYTAEGVRLRTRDNYKRFYLNGVYDLKEGLDVKYIVKDTNSAGTVNGCTFVSLIIVNADDPSYYAMYRVWLNQSGGDRPCNVYLITAGSFADHTDAGWITRTSGDVDGQFHMGFNMEETFVGERLGGMQKVDVWQAVETWLNACPSTNFRVALEASNLNADSDLYYEFTLSEFNGQSLAAPVEWNDAYLSVQSDIPQMIKKGESLTVDAYSRDIRGTTELKLTLTAPDGTTSEVAFDGRSAVCDFDTLGVYTITVSTVGLNGNRVEKQFEIECKESVEPVTVELSGEYKETYAKGESVTIISAVYSENAVTKTITVKKPDGTTAEVKAGDTFKFEKSGIYTVTYLALDGQSVPNKGEQIIIINVPDTEKPVITIGAEEKYELQSKIEPEIKITDDSACDVSVTVKKPDGTVVKLSAADGYAFVAETEGEYVITVTAEDEYGNKQTAEKTITVEKAGGSLVWIIVGCVAGVVVVTGVVLLVLWKKNVIFRKKKDGNE